MAKTDVDCRDRGKVLGYAGFVIRCRNVLARFA
jgi:hypothetical protein